MRLLIVEDEAELAGALADGLRSQGYAVDVALSGGAALAHARQHAYDLITLDLGLPDMDGLEVCSTLRREESQDALAPRIMIVTARDDVGERIRGLDLGADDYLVKPFALDELAARLRALSRRHASAGCAVVAIGDIVLDEAACRVTRAGHEIELRSKEYALLRHFVLHPGRVLSTEHLLEHVWDENADPFSAVVKVTVCGLRKRLGAPSPIETVPQRGYRLRAC